MKREIPPGFVLQPDGSYAKPRKVKQANVQNNNPWKTPESQPAVRNEPLAKDKTEKANRPRVLVRVKSFRRRLLDEDNLVAKYHIDCLRYAGLLFADDPSHAKIETSQEKVGKGDVERVEITIEEIP